MQVIVFGTGGGGGIFASINGVAINIASGYSGFTNMTGSAIVPVNATYLIQCAGISYFTYWAELR